MKNLNSSFRDDFLHTVCKYVHYLLGHQWPHRVRQQVGTEAVVGKAAQEVHQHLLVYL